MPTYLPTYWVEADEWMDMYETDALWYKEGHGGSLVNGDYGGVPGWMGMGHTPCGLWLPTGPLANGNSKGSVEEPGGARHHLCMSCGLPPFLDLCLFTFVF